MLPAVPAMTLSKMNQGGSQTRPYRTRNVIVSVEGNPRTRVVLCWRRGGFETRPVSVQPRARKHSRTAAPDYGLRWNDAVAGEVDLAVGRRHLGPQFFGGRNNATVISAEKNVSSWITEGREFKVASHSWQLAEVIETLEHQLQAS